MDSDMIVKGKMDDLMEDLELAEGWIAAAHACACNPRKLLHYPEDWYGLQLAQAMTGASNACTGYPPTVHTHH
jgi:hypothetical protein